MHYCTVCPFKYKWVVGRHVTYRGENAAVDFLEKRLEEEKKNIGECDKPMNLTAEETKTYETTSTCHICKEAITDEDQKGHKVRGHCHYSEKFRGAAHNTCNMRYRDSKKIPVFFHNLSGYDGHIIFQNISKVEGIKTPKVLTKNMEKYISFGIRNLHFKDSLQFLNSSLDKLVQNAIGKEKDFSILNNLREYFDKEWGHLDEEAYELLTRKGIYP